MFAESSSLAWFYEETFRWGLEVGEPVGKITSVAAETGADLVVVGHHQQGLWTRWMSRSVAAGLSDALGCSLLLAQKVVKESERSTRAEQV